MKTVRIILHEANFKNLLKANYTFPFQLKPLNAHFSTKKNNNTSASRSREQ